VAEGGSNDRSGIRGILRLLDQLRPQREADNAHQTMW